MYKVGIIGFGKMGQIRAQAFEKTGLCQISLVYDTTYTKDPPYRLARSQDEIILNEGLDIVVLCAPNYLNFPLTVKALEAGKHVFCEKPPCFTVQEMKKIREVESSSACKLMYGFNHRHHEAIKKMKTVVDSGAYGKVLWMRGRYGKSVDESYFLSWRSKKSLAGGGILLDQGIHMLDLFQYLGGDFDDVKAFVSNLYWNLEGVEDNVFAIMKNSQSGMVASLHSTMTQWRHLFSLEIFLERGYLVLNGLKTSSGTYGKEELTIARNRSKAPAASWENEERILFEVDSSWDLEAEHFMSCILSDKPVSIGCSEDALRVMSLVEKIYQNERHEARELHTQLKPFSKKVEGASEPRL